MLKADSDGRELHNFVPLDQFEKLGWQAKIAIGPEHGKTVEQFLKSQLAGQKPEESTWESCSHLWLDGRKSFLKTKPSNQGLVRQKTLLTPYLEGIHEKPSDPKAFLDAKAEVAYLPSTSSTPPELQTQKES